MPGLVNVDEAVRALRRSPRRTPLAVSPEPVQEVVTPESIKAMRKKKRFKLGERSYRQTSTQKESLNSKTELLKKYESCMVSVQDNVYDSFIEEKDPLDPFIWWNKVLKNNSSLLPVAKTAFKLLTKQLATAFSESQFTSAKKNTSAKSSRRQVISLNSRQFVRYNIHLVREEFDAQLENLEEHNVFYTECVEDLNREFKNELTTMRDYLNSRNSEEDTSGNSSTASPVMCEKCNSFSMKIFKAKD